MGRTGLTVRQLESMLFLTLVVALMIAAMALGGCAKGDLVPYEDQALFKRQERWSF